MLDDYLQGFHSVNNSGEESKDGREISVLRQFGPPVFLLAVLCYTIGLNIYSVNDMQPP